MCLICGKSCVYERKTPISICNDVRYIYLFIWFAKSRTWTAKKTHRNNYLFAVAVSFCRFIVFNKFIVHELKCQGWFSDTSTANHDHFMKGRSSSWLFRHLDYDFTVKLASKIKKTVKSAKKNKGKTLATLNTM